MVVVQGLVSVAADLDFEFGSGFGFVSRQHLEMDVVVEPLRDVGSGRMLARPRSMPNLPKRSPE